jgi:hypothetical protein
MRKEERFYTIELPESPKKKYTTEPYRSSHWWLRFLEFFDFGLPYRSRKTKVFVLLGVPSVIAVTVLLAAYYVQFVVGYSAGHDFIKENFGGFKPLEKLLIDIFDALDSIKHGGTIVLIWLLTILYILPAFRKREVSSRGIIGYGFVAQGINWARVERYICVYLHFVHPVFSIPCFILMGGVTSWSLFDFVLGLYVFGLFFPGIVPIMLTLHAVRVDDEHRGYYV